jgi:hypothetical protein
MSIAGFNLHLSMPMISLLKLSSLDLQGITWFRRTIMNEKAKKGRSKHGWKENEIDRK